MQHLIQVDAALSAINGGVQAVVIAAGLDTCVIDSIMAGDKVGTIFIAHPEKHCVNGVVTIKNLESLILKDKSGSDKSGKQQINEGEVEVGIPLDANAGSSQLQSLKSEERLSILLTMAEYLDHRLDDIYRANAVEENVTKLA